MKSNLHLHGGAAHARAPRPGVPALVTCLILAALLAASAVFVSPASAIEPPPSWNPADYVILAWNNLGMHCISPRFSEMAILPPYNNLMAQVILRGNPPRVVTGGFSLDYSIVNNTTVTGKTDFWDWVYPIFGANPAPGIGLTGNGLAGTMKPVGDHFEATGIPVLPFDDQMTWNPYQVAVVKLKFGGLYRKSVKAVVTLPPSHSCV